MLTATGTTSAAEGTYAVQVNQLAQAHKIKTSTFTDPTDVVGTGTINIQYGTYSGGLFTADGERPAETLTISTGNNTVQGISAAINAANLGIRASVVNDGTGYRLVISSINTGANNSLKITVADSDGTNTNTSGLSQLAYDPQAGVGVGKNMSETSAALNAQLIVDGISIEKSKNTISDIIDGVTLSLVKADVGVNKTISVTHDKSAVKDSIQSLVNSFNNVFNKTMQKVDSYDTEKKQATTLLVILPYEPSIRRSERCFQAL